MEIQDKVSTPHPKYAEMEAKRDVSGIHMFYSYLMVSNLNVDYTHLNHGALWGLNI
jgi:hypothetical protein